MTSCLAKGGHGYNGWPNYETWTVALWLDNDEQSYRHWRASARGLLIEAPTTDTVLKYGMSVIDAAICLLTDEIRKSVEACSPDLGATVYADLLNSALGEVIWREVARNIVEGVA